VRMSGKQESPVARMERLAKRLRLFYWVAITLRNIMFWTMLIRITSLVLVVTDHASPTTVTSLVQLNVSHALSFLIMAGLAAVIKRTLGDEFTPG